MNKFSYYNKEFINLQFFQLLNGAFSHLLHDLENGKKEKQRPGQNARTAAAPVSYTHLINTKKVAKKIVVLITMG